MPTNDEMWEKINADWYIIDTYDCGAEDEHDIDECDDEHRCFKHTKEWQDDIASRFRADTAKQIFEELDIFVNALSFSNATNPKISAIQEFRRDYEALRKKYKVD